MANGKKRGRWHGHEPRTSTNTQGAIQEVLNEQAPGTTWIVEMEVKRIGNPLHDYRIVLTPGTTEE